MSYIPQHMILQMGLTDICNLECIMCPLHAGRLPFHASYHRGFMDYHHACRILDDYGLLPVQDKGLLLQWFGESTLHERYFDIVCYALTQPFKTISLLTNGYGCSIDAWIGIMDFSCTESIRTKELVFHFSVDAVNEATYQLIKQRSGLCPVEKLIEQVIAHKAALDMQHICCIVQFIEMTENASEKQQFIEKWRSIFNKYGLNPSVVYSESEIVTGKDFIYIKPINELRAVSYEPAHGRSMARVDFCFAAPGRKEVFFIGSFGKNGLYDEEYLSGFERLTPDDDGVFRHSVMLAVDSRPYYADIFPDTANLDPNRALAIAEFKVESESPVQVIFVPREHADTIAHTEKTPVHYGKNTPCGFLFNNITVHHSGIATVCCSDTDFQLACIDLNTCSVTDMLNHPQIEKLRELHITGRRHTVKKCGECLFDSTISDSEILEYLIRAGHTKLFNEMMLKIKNEKGYEYMLESAADAYMRAGNEEKAAQKRKTLHKIRENRA